MISREELLKFFKQVFDLIDILAKGDFDVKFKILSNIGLNIEKWLKDEEWEVPKAYSDLYSNVVSELDKISKEYQKEMEKMTKEMGIELPITEDNWNETLEKLKR